LRGDLTDDAVTSLLTSLLPVRRQQRRQQQSRAGTGRSMMAGNSSLSLQASRNATTVLHLQLSPAPAKGSSFVSAVSFQSVNWLATRKLSSGVAGPLDAQGGGHICRPFVLGF